MAVNDTAGDPGMHRADSSTPPANGGPEDEATDVAELQADIERTRADLAHTVDQLTSKLDVKTRIRGRVAVVKDRATAQLRHFQAHATDDVGKPTPTTLGIAGGAVAAAAVLLVVLWRRTTTPRHTPRRSRRRR